MISVCIATYNGEKYIKEQLTSILSQLSDQDELILSDDCSTDNTLEIVRAFNDSRIRILEGRRFGSPAFNFENALKNATGDVIMLSDQDDIWREDKVACVLAALKNCDLIVSDAQIIDGDGQIIADSFFTLRGSVRGYWNNILKNSFLGCCMAFKKECLKYILPFPRKIAMHDIWIGLCVELYGKTLFLPEKLIKYRRHGSNASQAAEKSRYSITYRLKYRIYFIVYTLLRRCGIR